MDPPKSPHSHPDPLTPSGENNPPEQPPPVTAAASPTGKRKKITGKEPEKEQDDVIKDDDHSTPTKRAHAESSSKGKEKMEDNIKNEEREEEIQILKDILDYYDQNDIHPFAHLILLDLSDFHDTWFKDRRDKYPTMLELSQKMDELHVRWMNTFYNYEVVAPTMDPVETEIFELSQKIWGVESWTDSQGDHHHQTKDSTQQETNQDSKDLQETDPRSGNEPKDSTEQESSGYDADYSNSTDIEGKGSTGHESSTGEDSDHRDFKDSSSAS